jgi:hypothetical protein
MDNRRRQVALLVMALAGLLTVRGDVKAGPFTLNFYDTAGNPITSQVTVTVADTTHPSNVVYGPTAVSSGTTIKVNGLLLAGEGDKSVTFTFVLTGYNTTTVVGLVGNVQATQVLNVTLSQGFMAPPPVLTERHYLLSPCVVSCYPPCYSHVPCCCGHIPVVRCYGPVLPCR